MNRKAFSAPAVIICAVLLVLSAVVILLQNFGADAKNVGIYKDGKIIATLPLDEDAEYKISGADITVKIQNGAAFIQETSCKCKTCQNFGKLSKAGQTAVCLPNKVHIEILGDSGVDAVL